MSAEPTMPSDADRGEPSAPGHEGAPSAGRSDFSLGSGHPALIHVPRLVLSRQHRGTGVLDRIAAVVNRIVGSMWVFVAVTLGIVVWLFAGNVVGFDKTPWPLLLTILNLPQLSIMISLQVSANLAERTSDARALADHETLHALATINKEQLAILKRENEILDLLRARSEQR